MSEEEKRKLVLDNISKEALVDRVNFFFVREKYYRERTYDLENKIDKAIKYIEDSPQIVKSIHLRDKESNFIFIENKVKEELLEILGGKDQVGSKEE